MIEVSLIQCNAINLNVVELICKWKNRLIDRYIYKLLNLSVNELVNELIESTHESNKKNYLVNARIK